MCIRDRLSNKPHRQTVKVVREIFGEDVFDCAWGQQEGIQRKPDPEAVFKILEKLGGTKEECLYLSLIHISLQGKEGALVHSSVQFLLVQFF